MNISEESSKFIKKRKKEVLDQFIGPNIKSNKRPVFFFMAGAPGAGKTETSKWLIDSLQKDKVVDSIVRIDADEIRKIFEPLGYNGKNSDDYKNGCSKGISMLLDNCLKNKFHAVIDSTFSSLNVVKKNIEAAKNINAIIYIVYVYQDPLVAWGFTKIREKEEGRQISKEFFIDSLFKSIYNVNEIKNIYKDKVEIWLVEKDITNATKNIRFNIDNIENYLELKYNYEELNKLLYEEKD